MTLLMIPAVYDLTVVIQADAITVLLNIYILHLAPILIVDSQDESA